MSLFPRRLAIGRVDAAFFCSPHATPDLDPEAAVIESFQAARKSITFAIYSFTSLPIAKALEDAAGRGVQITGVADRSQGGSRYSVIPHLATLPNVALRYWNGSGLLHAKTYIVDQGTRVALGSYNWTDSAEKSNVEVLLVTRGRANSPYAVAVTNSVMSAFSDGTPIVAK